MNRWLSKYRSLGMPGKLVAVNVAVYVVTQLYNLFLLLLCVSGYRWQDFLALHSNLHDFLLRPWTLLTYMFVHADLTQDFFHLLFNMLWLYWFGSFFVRWHTGKQFLGLYLTGGLFSGLFFLAVYNLFPYFSIMRHYSVLVGASGAIMALIVAVAVRQPDEEVLLNFFLLRVSLKLKWLAVMALVLSCISVSGFDNVGGHVCHIGGIIWGLLYGCMERRGKDLTRGFNRWADKIVDCFSPRPKMKVHRGGNRVWPAERQKDMDYNARRRAQEAKIDAILDKIHKSGYEGLTEEEKRTLFDAGKK